MTTLASGLLIPVAAAALALAACGDDSGSGAPADTAAATAASSAATTVAPSTTEPAATTTPPGSADPTTTEYVPDTTRPPETAPPGPKVISITVGVDSGPDRVDRVAVGDVVTLVVTNPTVDDEFHLHGYDLGDGQEVPAGQTASFTFTASQAGEFELESHETDGVLLLLVVE
jgi:hypothetical protein